MASKPTLNDLIYSKLGELGYMGTLNDRMYAYFENFNGSGGSVVIQPVRTANFTVAASDGNTVIPVTGNVTVTVNSSSDLAAPVRIIRYDAGTLTVVQTAVQIIDPSTGSAWGTLSVVNYQASIMIEPAGVADVYSAVKIGA